MVGAQVPEAQDVKIGILETGTPPEPLGDTYGDYPAMLRRLLGEDAYAWKTYAAADGVYPDRIDAYDAYLVTGSPAGVYDGDPWIARLMDFLNEAKGKAALVGVCFGHQVMAEAFGGRVVKSDKGWGVGLHRYDVHARERWMDDARTIAIPVSHQDQVVELPPASRVIASSDFAPMAMLAYDDQPAISMQFHPEFEPAYATALVEKRRGTRLTHEEADRAVESLKAPDDRARVGAWIRGFLAGR
nr:type 1 glutamine amidotransferase [Caulobacter sp. 17J65-9]